MTPARAAAVAAYALGLAALLAGVDRLLLGPGPLRGQAGDDGLVLVPKGPERDELLIGPAAPLRATYFPDALRWPPVEVSRSLPPHDALWLGVARRGDETVVLRLGRLQGAAALDPPPDATCRPASETAEPWVLLCVRAAPGLEPAEVAAVLDGLRLGR